VPAARRRSPIAQLANLGPTSEQWLNAIGVYTRRDLEQLGSVNAYRLLKGHGFNATLNLVYAIEGALRGVDWNRLPLALKTELRVRVADAMKPRCAWCGTDPLYVQYHDEEWGVPVHDGRKHFEFLILEGAQAGLSWITILRKREGYREAFAEFDPARVARYGKREFARLMKNPAIVRNRLKIEGATKNARAFLAVQDEFDSFDKYVWRFVGGRPIQNRWKRMNQLPARTSESDALSKDLKKRGFTFVGSTIIYAHMQAVGMVNDHVIDCYRHKQIVRRR
jgi:DNA-3-methyladenine glycosylase I